ncbi:geranylgeranylglycerol-phosphate geranylgeranyltransferase [bacterium]|nr:geranylgeranylglycerol-phosphate geranylgeranyltransferase [bacterium]
MAAMRGYIELTRPVNMLICGLSVLCGGIIGDRPLTLAAELVRSPVHGAVPPWAVRTVIAAVSASFILAAGNILNDIRDVSTDAVNAPHRPIPSGRVSSKGAAVFAFLLTLAGIIMGIFLGFTGVVLALTAALLLTVYDLKLKGVPLAGNLTVSALGGLAFIYGGVAGHCVREALVPASFALLYHLGRELIKDAADLRGDRRAGIETVATLRGARAACRLASAVLSVLAVLVTIPSVTGVFGHGYTFLVVLGVCPVLIYSAISALRDNSEKNLRRVSTLLKAGMPTGIIAVLAGFHGW